MARARSATEPPEFLAEEAKAEWVRVLASHPVGPGERAILAAYCQAWARWRQAESLIEKDGTEIVIRDDKGNVKMVLPSPHVGIAARACAQMLKAAGDIGLTRGRRVEPVKPSRGGDPLAAMCGSAGDLLATMPASMRKQ